MSNKNHVEIILIPGETPEWVFNFSNKGLSQLRHGKTFTKGFASDKGGMNFVFCNSEVFEKQYKKKYEAALKLIEMQNTRNEMVKAGENAIDESKKDGLIE